MLYLFPLDVSLLIVQVFLLAADQKDLLAEDVSAVLARLPKDALHELAPEFQGGKNVALEEQKGLRLGQVLG